MKTQIEYLQKIWGQYDAINDQIKILKKWNLEDLGDPEETIRRLESEKQDWHEALSKAINNLNEEFEKL